LSLPWLLRDCHRRRCPLWRSFREVCLPLFWGFRVVVYMQLCGRLLFPFSCFVVRRFGVPAMLAATTPMSSGGVMINGHVLRLVRSTALRYVDVVMLLVVPFKNLEVSSSGRALASSCNLDVHLLLPLVRWLPVEGLLHSPVTKITGRRLYGLICNFLFIQGCMCKSCIVNLYSYM